MDYEGSGVVEKFSLHNVGSEDDGTNEENSEMFNEETFNDYVPIVNGELVSTLYVFLGVQGMLGAGMMNACV